MKKTVLVIGGGGREHAICWAFAQSRYVGKIFCTPGNAGIAQIAECLDISATDCDKILQLATQIMPDLIFVAPDNPLALGLVNMLEHKGFFVFGPTKEAAIIEYSKKFAKDFMIKYNIPTAKYRVFDNYDDANSYLLQSKYPVVLKADGLALGKGVIICNNYIDAKNALADMMLSKVFGDAGKQVIVEEFLVGKEITLLAFTDGTTTKLMPASQDYKRAYDNDEGKNTGGMGAFAPVADFESIKQQVSSQIVEPTIDGMNKENRKFKGVIYFGLICCADCVKVIEYNARMGDPETQVILPLLDTDFWTIAHAVATETLADIPIKWHNKSAVTVVLASKEYPDKVTVGKQITIPTDLGDTILFHAGTAICTKNSTPICSKGDNSDTATCPNSGINSCPGGGKSKTKLVTNGGRVLAVTAIGSDIAQARKKVYGQIPKIHFDGMRYRTDIGT